MAQQTERISNAAGHLRLNPFFTHTMNMKPQTQFELHNSIATEILQSLGPIFVELGHARNALDIMAIVMANVIDNCVAPGNEIEGAHAALTRAYEYYGKILDAKNEKASKLAEGINCFDGFARNEARLHVVGDEPAEEAGPKQTYERMVEQAEERGTYDREAKADAVDAGKGVSPEEIQAEARGDAFERELAEFERELAEWKAEEAAGEPRIDGDASEEVAPEQDPPRP